MVSCERFRNNSSTNIRKFSASLNLSFISFFHVMAIFQLTLPNQNNRRKASAVQPIPAVYSKLYPACIDAKLRHVASSESAGGSSRPSGALKEIH